MTLMNGTASSMGKSAQVLMKGSLWEQKTVKEKNEKGEEVEKTD